MFLKNSDLFPDHLLYIFVNVPHTYVLNLFYLRALAIVALNSYTNGHFVALFFGVSRLTRRALRNFIDCI